MDERKGASSKSAPACQATAWKAMSTTIAGQANSAAASRTSRFRSSLFIKSSKKVFRSIILTTHAVLAAQKPFQILYSKNDEKSSVPAIIIFVPGDRRTSKPSPLAGLVRRRKDAIL